MAHSIAIVAIGDRTIFDRGDPMAIFVAFVATVENIEELAKPTNTFAERFLRYIVSSI